MNEIKYIYFKNQENSIHNGVISIGYKIQYDRILYSVAFCSNNDRFEKGIAHKIITGRMESDVCSLAYLRTGNITYESIRLYMISELKQYNSTFADVKVPSWAEEIIKNL